MWIKYRYHDHGCSKEFKELEIPPHYEVVEYLCEKDLVPHWGERYTAGRIEYKRIKKPSQETLKRDIADLKAGIKWRKNKLKDLEKMLNS